MNRRLVLVVEDDEPKKRSIVSFLREALPEDVDIRTAESLTGAIAVLSDSAVDFAVIDMSIPTYDFVTDRRGGGQPLGFGGADILRFIDSETRTTKSVVVTQYEEFVLPGGGARRDRIGLEAALRKELDERFLGVVHYTGQHGDWRLELGNALGRVGLTRER